MRRTGLTSRRDFLRAGLGALAAPLFPACLGSSQEPPVLTGPRLYARPGIPSIAAVKGAQPLGLESHRDGILYVPQSYTAATPTPLWVALHGASGSASDWGSYYERAESRGIVLLVPDSRDRTWDAVMYGGFGPDAMFIDRALEHAFARCNVDPSRIALAGFSDGASYALSLGLPNGEMFTHLVAYSPGLMVLGYAHPRLMPIFVSHGTLDTVIPVENTREQIVPSLRAQGDDVTYREFEGPHGVPSEITEAALDWFLAGSGGTVGSASPA